MALIEAARSNGADTIVCVMSGNFVQRGSPAFAEKRVRARAALSCGADLVIELPLSCCVATAQKFARGGVFLLSALGCVDTLAFGSECGDAEALSALSLAIDEPRVTRVMREILAEGRTFAKARQIAVEHVCGPELGSLLASPNNALAVEYLRQNRLQGALLRPFTIKRVGASHDGETAQNGYASASFLRAHPETLSGHVPEKAMAVYDEAEANGLMPADAAKLEFAVLAYLRRLRPEELSLLPDISEGLEHRLYAAIRQSATLNELEQKLKTKRYTMARVRRLIISAFLGITARESETPPPYIRALGFTEKGRALLPKKGRLPFHTSLAALRRKGGACERFANLEETATDIYGLILPKPLNCGYEYTASGVYL
jgi:predicted nucleotidyltransferase